jgi:hypothetical protein
MPGFVLFGNACRSLAACGGAAALACLAVAGCGQAGTANSAFPGRTPVQVKTLNGGGVFVKLPSAPPAPPSPDWRQVAGVALPASAQISAIAATGPADAWAVGTTRAGVGEGQALLVHWDGARWSRPALPASMGQLSGFVSVAAANPADVWVMGYRASDGPTPHIYHFDGTRWDEVPLPGYVSGVEGLSMTPAGHLWAVVATGVDPGDSVIRWNGRTWARYSAPRLTGGPANIAALADNDIWVTGNPGQIYHWNGERWAPTASPDASRACACSAGGIPHIAALTSDDVWATADIGTAPSSPPVVMHWDGHAWRNVPVPHAGCCQPAGIAPDGAGGIWVIPSQSDWLGAEYLHWRAGRWTDVYARARPQTAEIAMAIAPVPGTQQVWSAESGLDSVTLNLYTPH